MYVMIFLVTSLHEYLLKNVMNKIFNVNNISIIHIYKTNVSMSMIQCIVHTPLKGPLPLQTLPHHLQSLKPALLILISNSPSACLNNSSDMLYYLQHPTLSNPLTTTTFRTSFVMEGRTRSS